MATKNKSYYKKKKVKRPDIFSHIKDTYTVKITSKIDVSLFNNDLLEDYVLSIDDKNVNYNKAGIYEAVLTATDVSGKSTETSVSIRVRKKTAREEIYEYVIKSLEDEKINFLVPWVKVKNRPYNPATGTVYKGINRFVLTLLMYSREKKDPRFYTFNQIQLENEKIRERNKKNRESNPDYEAEKCWILKKDSEGFPIEFFTYLLLEDGKSKKISTIEMLQIRFMDPEAEIVPLLNNHIVYNAEDIENCPEIQYEKYLDTENEIQGIANDFLNSYLKNEKISLKHKGNEAFYNIRDDYIQLPEIEKFKKKYGYLSTLAHEICHSTGAPHRMNREFGKTMNSKEYAVEELRAEISSAFLCADLGIEKTEEDMTNHTAYIKSWLEAVKKDKNELFKAIKESQEIEKFVIERSGIDLGLDEEYEIDDEFEME